MVVRDTINGSDPIRECIIPNNANQDFRRGAGACDNLHVVMVI